MLREKREADDEELDSVRKRMRLEEDAEEKAQNEVVGLEDEAEALQEQLNELRTRIAEKNIVHERSEERVEISRHREAGIQLRIQQNKADEMEMLEGLEWLKE